MHLTLSTMAPYGADPAVYTVPVPDDAVYVHTDDCTMLIPMPVAGFYTRMPEDATCTFSVTESMPEKRTMKHLFPLRVLEKWSEARIARTALRLFKIHTQDVLNIEPPTEWVDLYRFFDAEDLWKNGAWNLWLVIYLLIEKAERYRALVANWVFAWLTTKANRDKLRDWDPRTDILDLMGARDWLDGGILESSAGARDLVRRELFHWYNTTYSPFLSAGETVNVRNWIGK